MATRPAWRGPVDSALSAAGNPAQTLALRVALLENQSRRADLEALLAQATAGASPELLIEIRQHAQRSGLVDVERRAMDRQYALADHPAAKMAALAERLRFEEAANAAPAAAQAAETLLRENPRSVGAIRTAVNYFWRAGQKARAADVLLTSAGAAYPALQRQFRLEAIQKLNESGDYARAHREADRLLQADPLDETLLALKADAYARAKDDRALAALYRDTLAALQKSALAAPVKAARAATLRRAWIPALVRLNDAAGAADQYIELLKQFPEDEALQREAARFAAGAGQRERITNFFAKAESDSPRDARWPQVRAGLETEFGDFNAALAAWGRAVALRPERVDLLTSRARLEERLSQFDKAIVSYRKLHEISFRNPVWLEDAARVQARQGKLDDAAKTLREALVANRPAAAENHVAVARRLLEWNAVEQARAELQQGLGVANANSDLNQLASLYAHAATRLRQFDGLPAALNARTAGMSADRLTSFRQAWLNAAANAAGQYFTPEEKTRFGVFLEAQRAAVPAQALAGAALSAGLADTAARIYAQALMAAPAAENAREYLDALTQLQTRRQQFGELGRQIEAYHRVAPNNDEKAGLLHRARRAFFAAGDDAGELRTLAALQAAGAIAEDESERYFELIARRAPATLSARQAQDANFMDALANYALRTGKAPVATQAIANRRSPLWQNVHRAVTGLYFGENSPAVRKAFLDSLGPERIGDKLALAGNRDATLAGDVWFYYAGRYGAWLQLAQDTNAPHYQAAMVERRANSAEAYFDLAEESAGAAAEQAYRTALTLDEHLPAAYSRLAAIALAKGDRTAAVALWRQAVDELRWWQDNRRIQQWFWPETARALREAGAAGFRAELRDPVDTLLRAYIKQNGAYRVRELIEAALALSGDPASGVQWIAQLSRSAADPAGFLAQINSENWLPEAGRESLLKLQLDFAVDHFNRATGEARGGAQDNVNEARLRYASYLLKHNKPALARPIVEALTANPDARDRQDVAELRLLLAAADKRVETVVAELGRDSESLRALAANLRQAGLAAEARTVLFAAHEQDLRGGDVEAAIPGLAALQIEAGAPEKALPLLDVYVMQSAVPFARHQTAGELFLRAQRKAEAVRYLEPLVAAEPWNRAARASLAEARDDEAALAALAADSAAAYADRLRAARWIAANRPKPIQSGAAELDFLAANNFANPPAAEQPLWAAARRAAVTAAKDNATRIRLLRGAVAIHPSDDETVLILFRTLLQAGRPREAASSIEDREHIASEPDDRARLADAYVRTGQLQRALNIFDMLFQFAPPEQTRRWQAAAATVRAQAERDQRNEERRPVVGEELEQRNLVKPRLAAAQGGAR